MKADIPTLEGVEFEKVSTYKYLGVWFDDELSFTSHIDHLLKILKATPGFLLQK